MKTKTLLIAAVMFFGISVAAFAQATYTIGSIPVSTVVASGITEKTGDITFTSIPSTGTTVTGTITVTYTSPVTFRGTIVPVPDVLYPGNMPTFGTPTLLDAYTVTFTITPAASGATLHYGFRLTGVRVNVAGNPGAAPLFASITTTGNGYVAGEDTVRVVNAIADGIASFTSNGPVQYNALTGALVSASANVTLTAREGFAYVWGVTPATDATQTVSTMVKVYLSGTIPAGVTLTFPATDTTGRFTRADAYGNIAGTTLAVTSAATPIYYRVTADTNQIAVEDFAIIVATSVAVPTTEVYSTSVSITAYAVLAPIESEIAAGYPATYTNWIPRYDGTGQKGPTTTLISFAAAYSKSILLVPYVTTAQDFDTGIAIANTTTDPGSLVTGFTSPIVQAGKIKFFFYGVDGAQFSVDTAANYAALPQQYPLTTGGLVPSGKSYITLLSQLLTAAGRGGTEFSGYMIAVCDFTHAHGQTYVSDFDLGDFDNGSLMLVVSPKDASGNSITSRAQGVPESFGF